jgi:hypothetical protein
MPMADTPTRIERFVNWLRNWYDLTVGLLLAPIGLAVGMFALIVGNLIGRVVGAVAFLFAIRIAAPRLAELQRRRRSRADSR